MHGEGEFGWLVDWVVGGMTEGRRNGLGRTYHCQCPDGVVEEDDGGGHQHGEADEFVKLPGGKQLAFMSAENGCVV